jgi:hypothetical protein
MSTTGSTTGSTPSSTTSTNVNANTNANNTAAPAPTTTTNNINTDYTKTVNVKKVPFDETEASFYPWTLHILGFTETYDCAQALLGTFEVPPAVLSDADPDENYLLMGR